MEIRGQRRCQACGERWSYYDTGRVTCPDCGSIRSVGVDERTKHTDGSVDLDLSTARQAASEDKLDAAAEAAASTCAEYTRIRGFIHAGSLQELDQTFVTAHELRRVGDVIQRTMRPTEAMKRYFIELLSDAPDGARPSPASVPEDLHHAKGLAASSAADAYLRELSTWMADNSDTTTVSSLAERLRDHIRRVDALDGEVPPQDAEQLITAARALGKVATTQDATATRTVETALDSLNEIPSG